MNSDSLNYIRFWGVRGSYPAPYGSHMRVGGNTSCVELRVNNHILICDGGSGIIPLGQSLLAEEPEIKEVTILLSHYHWDHISGLPFFAPAFLPDWKVNIYGPGDSKEEIEMRVSGQMTDPYFPVAVEVWSAEINYLKAYSSQLEYGPFKVENFSVHHPGSTFGYKIQVKNKTIIYASDNEITFVEEVIAEDNLEPEELELFKAMQEEEQERYVEIIENAEVLIHDAQYTPEDYVKKRGWGHSCYIDTANLAMDAHVKQLYLFHIDPNYDDNKVEGLHQDILKLVHQNKLNLNCKIAREGLIVDIDQL